MTSLSNAFKVDYPEHSSVVQGMSFLVKVTFTGDKDHAPVDGNDSITLTSKNPVVQIQSDSPKPDVHTDSYTIIQQFIITVGEDAQEKDIDLTFATSVKEVDPQTFNYTSVATMYLNPDSFAPLVSSNTFVKDKNPAPDLKDPTGNNPGILVDLYAKLGDGSPLVTQIPLKVEFGHYVRIYAANDDGTIRTGGEIFPAQQHLPPTDYLRVFYVRTDQNGHATIKIFPRQLPKPIPVTVALSVYFFDYGSVPGSSPLLFVTTDLERSVNYPGIYELDGGNRLTPPESGGSFHPTVPRYKGAKLRDRIFFMNSHGKQETLLGMMTIDDDRDYYIPKLAVPYAAITNTGTNHLYYYTVNLVGNFACSENLVYNMTKHASNKPDDGVTRIFLEPKISDGNGEYLSDDVAINLQALSFGNLTCHVPVKPGANNSVAKGDVVGVNVYINGYNPDGSLKSNKLAPPSFHTKTVQQTDVDAGMLNFTIPAGTFAAYDSDSRGNPGIVYIEYFTQGGGEDDQYSIVWEARIDTVPPGRSDS